MDWGGFFLFNALCDLFSSRDYSHDDYDDDLPVYTTKHSSHPQSTQQEEDGDFGSEY